MIVYIDENISHFVAKSFAILQTPLNNNLSEPINILYIPDEFEIGVDDELWIPKAGQQGSCAITQDINIKRTKHQFELCEKFGMGMFFLRPPSKNGFTYWQMVTTLVKNWQEIQDIVLKQERPFTYRITAKGKLAKM